MTLCADDSATGRTSWWEHMLQSSAAERLSRCTTLHLSFDPGSVEFLRALGLESRTAIAEDGVHADQ